METAVAPGFATPPLKTKSAVCASSSTVEVSAGSGNRAPPPLEAREPAEHERDEQQPRGDDPLEAAAAVVEVDPEDDLDPVSPDEGQQEQRRAQAREPGLGPESRLPVCC